MSRILFCATVFLVLVYGLICLEDSHRFHHQREKRGANRLWNETYLDRLRNDLLLGYDKFSKSDNGNTTNVEIGLTIVYLETDELNSTFSSSIWLHLSWNDPKLRWNSHNYNEIDSVKLSDHEIWQPDIYLFNSANSGGDPIIRYGNPHALVYPDGSVTWTPPIKVNALCEFDMYYWPFDTQHCHLRFGSSTRSRSDIRLVPKGVKFESLVRISQWTITATESVVETTRVGYPEEFFHAIYNLTLVRKWSTTTTVASTMIFCTISLVLVQRFFKYKTEKGLILPYLTTIVLCILLIHFGTKVSPKRSTAPWIVSFLGTCLLLHCIGLIQSTFVVYLFKFKNIGPVSWRIKRWLDGRLGQFLLLRDCVLECEACANFEKDVAQHDQQSASAREGKCAVVHEWELCIVAIDRFLFVVYFVIITLCVLAYVI